MHNLHTTSATIATLEELARQHYVDQIILLATYFPLKGTGVHNFDLLQRIEGHPLFRMFGSLDVMNNLEAGLDELEKLAEGKKIIGIKLYPGYQGFEPSEPRLEPVYALAEKYHLPVMLHGGELHHSCPPERQASASRPCGCATVCKLPEYSDMAHPRYIEKPARAHPNVKFVVSHLSNPFFGELRRVMTGCPNVFTDISGQFVSGRIGEDTPEYRKHIVAEIKQFLAVPNGYRRVLFATDFPIQSYADSLDLVDRLNLNAVDRENIMSGNALRVLDKTFIPKERNV